MSASILQEKLIEKELRNEFIPILDTNKVSYVLDKSLYYILYSYMLIRKAYEMKNNTSN